MKTNYENINNNNNNNNNNSNDRGISSNRDILMEDVRHLNESLRQLEETVKRQLKQHGKIDLATSADPMANGDLTKRPTRSLSVLRKSDKISEPSMPNRKDKVVVQVRIVLLKVGDIDTLRDKFAGDAFIQAKWREPALDGKFKMQYEPMNWEVYWNPKLSIDNAFGEPKESVWHSLSFDGAGQATVCEKRRITGTFFEFMELNQFPFDSQMLSVSVTTERSDNELEFVEDSMERSVLFTTSFTDEQEWRLNKGIVTWIKFREDSFKSESCKHPSFSAAATVTRRPQFFIWNILVVMFLICSLSFATFSVSYDIPQTRLQLTFILLLTTVSFKFVVNQNLPMISYLTYLDKYILGSMAILASICVWHAIAGYLSKRSPCIGNLSTIDYWMLGVLGSIYLGFHIFFVVIISCKSNNKDSGEEPDDKEAFCEHQEDEFEDQRSSPKLAPRPVQKSDHRGNRRVSDADQVTAQAALSSWQ